MFTLKNPLRFFSLSTFFSAFLGLIQAPSGSKRSSELTLNFRSKQRETVTVCPRSSDTFYIVGYNIKWVTTNGTEGRTYTLENLLSLSLYLFISLCIEISYLFLSCIFFNLKNQAHSILGSTL